MSIKPVLDYYGKRLIIQYRTKDRAVKTVELIANQSYIDGFPLDLRNCYDLETAQGEQLTIIGKIVGVPRNAYELDLDHLYFNLCRYNEVAEPGETFGFGRYTDVPYDPSGALFFRYNFLNAATYTLLDPELRILIKLKIILNNSFSSFKEIKDLIYQYFAGDIDVVDNQDMTLTYNVNQALSRIAEAALTLGLLPKPMGVGIIFNYV